MSSNETRSVLNVSIVFHMSFQASTYRFCQPHALDITHISDFYILLENLKNVLDVVLKTNLLKLRLALVFTTQLFFYSSIVYVSNAQDNQSS